MKGSLFDMVIVMVVILITAITVILSSKILTGIQTVTTNETLNQTILNQGATALHAYDYGILFFVVAGFLSVVILAFMLRSHPAFLPVGIFVMVLLILLAAIVGNVYSVFVEQAEIVSTASSYPVTTQIFQNLPTIVLIFGAVIMIVIYSKMKDGGLNQA